MPVYEVIGIERPLKKDIEESGALETLVFGPVIIVARNDQHACMQAILKNDDAKKANQERLDVLVRLFG